MEYVDAVDYDSISPKRGSIFFTNGEVATLGGFSGVGSNPDDGFALNSNCVVPRNFHSSTTFQGFSL